ncbi:F-box/FBD/LRR-repeat protein [Camellia lanceoleosa]|uniref:F-box/FBD/LRR-repeat protein n=1 Tax=Camellia lanceoleosa TaxID=1840588 RepID=A0ACC0GAG9_9ERIC|nr:F-box/FBD/LRR-repeat protein [Camellia lanceoleosa]
MDRNSYLTQDVMLKILVFSCIGTAEKTSILSGNPVYAKNWSPHPDVVVDSNFWEEHWTRNPRDQEAAAEIVSGILRDHRGPIRKLILSIPQLLVEVVPVIRYDWAQHINKWMFSLPQNDIEEIILYNYNDETYKIGFLYLLVNLTRLVLGNCIFYQPFGGFGNLHCIRLDNIEFGSDMVGTVTYNFPNLTFFKAVNCSGFRHLKIEVPNLKRFNVCATNGDGISMYESDQIRLKLDAKLVKGVDLVYNEGEGLGLVYLIEFSIHCRPQNEESWRQTGGWSLWFVHKFLAGHGHLRVTVVRLGLSFVSEWGSWLGSSVF